MEARTEKEKRQLYEQIMRSVSKTLKQHLNEEASGTETLENRLKTAFEQKTLVEKLQSASAELSDAVENSIEALKIAIDEKDAEKKNSYLKNLLKYHKIYLKTLNKMTTLKK